MFVGGRVLPGRYPAPASSRLFRNLGGQWLPDDVSNGLFEKLGLVSGAVWTDLEGLGVPALALATEWGPIRVFRQKAGALQPWDAPLVWSALPAAGQPPRPARLSQLTGWWNGITAGDFDGDGRLDLVVGNWGLNCKYREFLANGLRVFHGDVDGDGTWDVIEAYWEPSLNQLVPWRNWKTIRAAIPRLSDRFQTYRDYARASVPEILGPDFAKLQELRVDGLASLVLLNRGDHFEVRELPREAQLAPVFGLCVGDYDGDGHEDLFLSQNFFATDQETGRYDAGRGLWLQGDGQGGFRAVPGQESGIKVYGEQRGAAPLSADCQALDESQEHQRER